MKLAAIAAAALLAADAAPPAIRLHLGCVDGLPALLVVHATGPGMREVRLLDLIALCESARSAPPARPATPT